MFVSQELILVVAVTVHPITLAMPTCRHVATYAERPARFIVGVTFVLLVQLCIMVGVAGITLAVLVGMHRGQQMRRQADVRPPFSQDQQCKTRTLLPSRCRKHGKEGMLLAILRKSTVLSLAICCLAPLRIGGLLL